MLKFTSNLRTCKRENIHKFYLPESKDERIVFKIVKTKKTDGKYPRKTGIPAKKPL